MEELKRYVFDGEEYISKKSLLKCLREISDAVNSFSDRADPIRTQGANKVISLLLEKIEPPREHWKPSEEQMNALNALNCHGDLSYVGQQNQLISLQKDLEKLKGGVAPMKDIDE